MRSGIESFTHRDRPDEHPEGPFAPVVSLFGDVRLGLALAAQGHRVADDSDVEGVAITPGHSASSGTPGHCG